MIDKLRPFAVIGAAVSVAAVFPWVAYSDCNAPLNPEVTVFWIVIPLIFLFEGLSLPTSAVWCAAGRYGLHATVLAYNFAFIPLAILAMVSLQDFFFPFARGLHDGYLALAAVPTTTSMCVMHSNASGANAPLAAFAALLANVVAVVLTPLLLRYCFLPSCTVPERLSHSNVCIPREASII
jgi:predicted Na+-dependent transporter